VLYAVLSDQIHDAPAVVALLWMCLIVEFANPGPVPSTLGDHPKTGQA
jgi:hypothetical protein